MRIFSLIEWHEFVSWKGREEIEKISFQDENEKLEVSLNENRELL